MRVGSLVLFVSLTARLAFAQTPPSPPTADAPRISQEVVVTATVAPVPLEAVGRTVTIVTREDLERIGVTSVIEALRMVPGVDPRARGPQDVQTDFSIRGSTFGQNLILVDGIRINDSQSGHHNGEIPAAVSGIDRIEVVYGAGSAVHGADALGGTINVITRRGAHRTANVEFGQHGYVSAQGSVSGGWVPETWSVTGWTSRSSGFMFDRDFAQGGGSARGTIAQNVTLDVRHQRRAFGANGFYGNLADGRPAPSKEWTDQTLASVAWSRDAGGWLTTVSGLFRNHHDHFLWDMNRPGFAENRHRTDAYQFDATAQRELPRGVRASIGLAVGRDWVKSSNLGNHHFAKTSAFGELLVPLGAKATMQGGVRLDGYSTFGRSVSPSVSMAARPRPDLRLRFSVGRAFRVPTFTELYYSDPGNLGSPDLVAERGWSIDAGGDWTRGGWTLSISPFRRVDSDVIDWVKATAPERWRSTNVRDVTTVGIEASLTRSWRQAFLRLHFAGTKVDAPALNQLSKYVLEYARRQNGGSISVPVWKDGRFSVNVDHRHRLGGQTYDLVSARVTHSLPKADIYLDGSNLLNESYYEVTGVTMPGRWIMVGVTIK